MADRKSDLAFAAFFGSGKSGGGGSDNAVLFTQQTLTTAQQAQARTNIGAVSLGEIGTVFTLKGGVPTVEDLPASGNSVGDVYYVESVSAGYIWLTSASQPNGYWEELGETFDVTVDSELSPTSENPVQNKVINAALAAKGTYSKPSGGIPKTDLASTVQTSLGKADTALQSVPSGYATETWVTNKGYGTYSKPTSGIPKSDLASAVQTSLGKADTALQVAPVISVNGKTGVIDLDANDVGALPNDTPIPAAVTEQTVSGWGFTKNTGTYSKPSGGIPKSDLSSAVQTSLGKADTALQSVPSTYRTAAAQDLIDATLIPEPANPAAGAFLVYNGSAWVAQTLSTWQGGSY